MIFSFQVWSIAYNGFVYGLFRENQQDFSALTER